MNQKTSLQDQILSHNPTAEQQEAIFSEELEFLLRASPGSGKTWTSCRRFMWRGDKRSGEIGGLALLSFTNAAIREFYAATVDVGRRELLSEPNYVGTLDSFVERFIITPFGHLTTRCTKRPKLFLAPRPGDRGNKNLQVWHQFDSGLKKPIPAWEIIPQVDGRTTAFRVFNGREEGTLEPGPNSALEAFFALGNYTHSQRVYLACRTLSRKPRVAQCLSRRFPEIIVDEAQDSNDWLIVLLNILRNYGTKVTLVGDPDQCIYEFGRADAESLPALKKKWGLQEKPLSRSFRCNDPISAAVRHIGGNISFSGCGPSASEYHGPFVVRDPGKGFNHSISVFEHLLGKADVIHSNAAILCRGREQLELIRGDVNYTKLQGLTKKLAQAAFFRDVHKDYKLAYTIVEKTVREIAAESSIWNALDEAPESENSHRIRLAMWRFCKSLDGLPSLSNSEIEWIKKLKTNLSELFHSIGIRDFSKMGQKIRKTGLDEAQLNLALFKLKPLTSSIRQETIHQVKGEGIDGVLVLGASSFFNNVVNAIESCKNTEERRLAYVAVTRARHVLLIGLPAKHFDKYASKWTQWGFKPI